MAMAVPAAPLPPALLTVHVYSTVVPAALFSFACVIMTEMASHDCIVVETVV